VNRLQEAVVDCNEALRLRLGDDAFSIRGLVYLKLKKLELALTDYDSALQANPKNAFSLYGRGIAKRWNGDEAGAIADISAAEQIMPDIAADFGRYGVSAP
jgi:tetratricopeptide (TPR) repeat protein